MTNLESVLKRRHHFADKSSYSQGYDLSSSHVWMWELDHKKGRMPKNWCFWTVLLEKTLESHLSSKRSNQSILKEINPEYSLEGLMLKLKLGHLMQRTNPLEKTLNQGKTEGRWKEGNRGVGWHHWFNGHELGQTLGDGEGQGSLPCCRTWDPKESDSTWPLNNNSNIHPGNIIEHVTYYYCWLIQLSTI